jgi:NAD-dependent dihydropyrimidine dehydrogenase PreA subunit
VVVSGGLQLQIVEFATGSMTRPEKLVVRLTDLSGPEERGKVDEISAHACINDMSVVSQTDSCVSCVSCVSSFVADAGKVGLVAER